MTNWVIFCKRTEDPKLAWIERELEKRGIPCRRNGYSFHAPILEVPEEFEQKADALLQEKAPARLRRWWKTVDDIPDDHQMFQGSMA